MWHLINNNLKIFIDPLVFSQRDVETISKQVNFVDTLQNYLQGTDPSLCNVTFFYPRYAETALGISRRIFMPDDHVEFIDTAPDASVPIIEVLPTPNTEGIDTLLTALKTYNECVSLAVANHCAYMLTVHPFHADTKYKLRNEYGLQLVTLEELIPKVEHFLQGFYNYFKFSNPVYGIRERDITHTMSDTFFKEVLLPFETKIRENAPTDEVRERIRSFIYNRYADLLVCVDQIDFYKINQQIDDIERELIDNKEPAFHGHVRFYLNYYLLLLWGSVDHLAWIMNDVFKFGYNPELSKDRIAVGLNKMKDDFLKKVKSCDIELYEFILSDDFQEWLSFLSQLRHQNAHREMFSASPLLVQTDESNLSDGEIDKIIYKDRPVFEPETEGALKKFLTAEQYKQTEENQKANDRYHFRISKSKKGLEHVAIVKKGSQRFMFDPVIRIPKDLEILQNLIKKIGKAYASSVSTFE